MIRSHREEIYSTARPFLISRPRYFVAMIMIALQSAEMLLDLQATIANIEVGILTRF
jgi:hypothetical protein